MPKSNPELPPQWCLVGNVIEEHPYGQEHQIRRGSKHFLAGTRVYCLAPRWDGLDEFFAIGLHRGSRRFTTVIMRTNYITNWRSKQVFQPEVLRRITEVAQSPSGRSWASREEVEQFAGWLNEPVSSTSTGEP